MSKDFNGGYQITLGTTKWDLLNGYTPSWENEEKENFENYDFSTFTEYKGTRFSAAFKVGKLCEADKEALLRLLQPRIIQLTCPDYSGQVKISGVGAELISANSLGKWYTVSFTATATSLTKLSDGF